MVFKVDILGRDGLGSMALFDQVEHSQNSPVYKTFLNVSSFQCFEQLSIVIAAVGWHLQVHSCSNCFHAVFHSAPVTDEQSLEAPFFSCDFCEKYLVLAGVVTIDAIVRRHDRPWLCFTNHNFKRLQIDFTQRSFLDLGITDHAPIFLVVDCKVF